MKKLWICFFCILFATSLQAQEENTISMPRLRLGIEAGVNFLFGPINKPDLIRENQSFYFENDYDYYCGFVSDEYSYPCFYVGIKPEYVLSKRFVVASGLHFYFNNTDMKSDRESFLWKIAETETSSNYIKINKISQKSYYLGIPVEIKFYPKVKDYFVRQYFVLGTSLNFLLTSKNEVVFQNSDMKKYKSQVTDHLGKPNLFLGTVYAGLGLKFGRSKYPFGSVEFHFPVISYGSNNKKSFAKLANIFGFGMSTTLEIPMVRKHQLTYTIKERTR